MEHVNHLSSLNRVITRPFYIGIETRRILDQYIFVVQKVYRDGCIVDVIPYLDYDQAARFAKALAAFTEDLVSDELAALDQRCSDAERGLRETEQRFAALESAAGAFAHVERIAGRSPWMRVWDAVAEAKRYLEAVRDSKTPRPKSTDLDAPGIGGAL